MAGGNQYTKQQSRADARTEFLSVFKFRKTLKDITESVQTLKNLATGDADPSPARVGAAKAVADINLKLLGKMVPDLKAVELSGTDDSDIQRSVEVRLVAARKRVEDSANRDSAPK